MRGAVVVVVVVTVEDAKDVAANAVVAFLLLFLYCFLRESLYLFRQSSLPTPGLRAPPNFEQGGFTYGTSLFNSLVRMLAWQAGGDQRLMAS